jgi:hypothetical protein
MGISEGIFRFHDNEEFTFRLKTFLVVTAMEKVQETKGYKHRKKSVYQSGF